LEGTHVKEGEKLLEDSGLEIIAAVDLLDAAKKIVSQVQEVI
jgi:succinyl-CoA synthetase beta subunit